ncbi:MAG: glycoside hydrolase, partial [Deltaproteobacteria bacterium]|nr:glycoside hydrolase [Deltaproteobacteria bacterium]
VQGFLSSDFIHRFLGPWAENASMVGPEKVFWGVSEFQGQPGYGENLRPHDIGWIAKLEERSRIDEYPSQCRRAIIVRHANVRVFPTHRPHYSDIFRAGQGYPFDNFQNSALWAGTPVLVTHATSDGAWILVEASNVFGWVESQDAALVDENFIRSYVTGAWATPVSDGFPLVDGDGTHRFFSMIGSLYPQAGSGSDDSEVLIPVRDADGQAVIRRTRVSAEAVRPFPLPALRGLFVEVARALAGQPYGWGGMYRLRDCSAMVQDYFLPFGVWMPRNSSQQARAGRTVDLESLEGPAKEFQILAEGEPWLTTLWKPGHIMLYIGRFEGRPVVLHNAWGLRTKSFLCGEGRRLIGAAVVTTLNPEDGVPCSDPDRGILRTLKRMTFPCEERVEAGHGEATP